MRCPSADFNKRKKNLARKDIAMKQPILKLKRQQRRNLERLLKSTRHRFVYSRCKVLLAMTFCTTVVAAARKAGISRSTANSARNRYVQGGIRAISNVAVGRKPYKVTRDYCKRLKKLIKEEPEQYGWNRSRWSSELLSKQMEQETGIKINHSHLRRLLSKLDIVYRRPAPYIKRVDPKKQEKLANIRRILRCLKDGEVAIYEDEVDIHLLPKMGPQWTEKGKQPQVGTPGKNQKRYIAGGLNVKTGDVHWFESDRKNSRMFCDFLGLLSILYPDATRIYVIADNYIIHKSKILAKMMKKEGLTERFEIVFLPTYSPKYNPVERLWKCLHDTVTRNHKHDTIGSLLRSVHIFILQASPFPGNGHGIGRCDDPLVAVLDL